MSRLLAVGDPGIATAIPDRGRPCISVGEMIDGLPERIDRRINLADLEERSTQVLQSQAVFRLNRDQPAEAIGRGGVVAERGQGTPKSPPCSRPGGIERDRPPINFCAKQVA